MPDQNASAADLWRQLFERMASEEDAAIVDPHHDEAADEARLRNGLAEAGWSEGEIQQRIDFQRERLRAAPKTSPGVNPLVEAQHGWLCDDVEKAMSRLGMDSHARVARGVEPRLGPIAAKTNVVLTGESIVTVGSFLFRFCGLVARAFVRTLHLNPWLWEDATYTDERGRELLLKNPRLVLYWWRMFASYALTGTNAVAPYWPANRWEVMEFEQVARAMEIFAVAHEYGHHHLNHGRILDVDPKLEEFDADRFALTIGCEVEHEPVIAPNPYLYSGAGGIVILLALKILREFEEDLLERPVGQADTHPDALSRIARFEAASSDIGEEFARLKNFRLASERIMSCVRALLCEWRGVIPHEQRARIRGAAGPVVPRGSPS